MQSPSEDVMSPPSNKGRNGKIMEGKRKVSKEEEFEMMENRGPVNVDEQVIPTMNNNMKGKNNPPQEYEYGAEEDKEVEDLTGDKIVQAQPMIAVFGATDVKKIFSRTWQLREEGINNIESLILNEGGLNEGKAFVNGVGVVRYTVGDKMAQVA